MICIHIYPVSLSPCVSSFSGKTSVTLQGEWNMKSGLIHSVLFVWLPQVFTFTFGPGAPWMPGCPCMHLQGFRPSLSPISACPPHCQRQHDLDSTDAFLTDSSASCGIRADAPRWRAHSSPQSEPSLGRTTPPSAGDPPLEERRSYHKTQHIYEDPNS